MTQRQRYTGDKSEGDAERHQGALHKGTVTHRQRYTGDKREGDAERHEGARET